VRLHNEAVGKLDVRLDPSSFKDSAIIAEVTIVDCRASAEAVFSTSPVANGDTGFSYILNAYDSAAAESSGARAARVQ